MEKYEGKKHVYFFTYSKYSSDPLLSYFYFSKGVQSVLFFTQVSVLLLKYGIGWFEMFHIIACLFQSVSITPTAMSIKNRHLSYLIA